MTIEEITAIAKEALKEIENPNLRFETAWLDAVMVCYGGDQWGVIDIPTIEPTPDELKNHLVIRIHRSLDRWLEIKREQKSQ